MTKLWLPSRLFKEGSTLADLSLWISPQPLIFKGNTRRTTVTVGVIIILCTSRHECEGSGRRKHGSPRRSRSPPSTREVSKERRAKIEQWNQEREEKEKV
ncbi:hypothetical protein V6N13_071510 [Hibiscus sabdariffa]|uniref:Uncharacterized protein n=1 Tax=Hibiscus sabdariffa TaxID=183260 RepID=A0ABR2TD67_9ROSI